MLRGSPADGVQQWEFASLQLFNGWPDMMEVQISEEIREVLDINMKYWCCESKCVFSGVRVAKVVDR